MHILPKYPHIRKPIHYKTHIYTRPNITKQVKRTTVQVKTNTVQGYVAKGQVDSDNTGQQNLTFFFVPGNSVDELSSTYYAEFRYVYRMFFIKEDFKDTEELNVQNRTLRAHETDRNFPLKCTGL